MGGEGEEGREGGEGGGEEEGGEGGGRACGCENRRIKLFKDADSVLSVLPSFPPSLPSSLTSFIEQLRLSHRPLLAQDRHKHLLEHLPFLSPFLALPPALALLGQGEEEEARGLRFVARAAKGEEVEGLWSFVSREGGREGRREGRGE